MNKLAGIALVITGIILIVISILALVKAFDLFNAIGKNAEDVGYMFGSIVVPLFLTVLGRWIFRKGKQFLKSQDLRK